MKHNIHQVLLFVICSTVLSAAQLRNMVVDSDTPLKDVHEVSVFINMGATLPAPYVPDFERVKKQISQKLAKSNLKLVVDAKVADVVLVVTEYDVDAGSVTSINMTGNVGTSTSHDRICLADEIKAYKGGKQPTTDDAPIWSVNEYCGFSWPANRAMDKFLIAIKKAREVKK